MRHRITRPIALSHFSSSWKGAPRRGPAPCVSAHAAGPALVPLALTGYVVAPPVGAPGIESKSPVRRLFPCILTCILVMALGPVEALAGQEPNPLEPSTVESPSAGVGEQPIPDSPLRDAGAASGIEEDWLKHRIDLLDEVTFTRKTDSIFNPGGAVYPTDSLKNTLRLNAEFGARLPADFSVKAQVSSALNSGSETETVKSFSLRELYVTAPLGDFELSIGRKVLKWTNGYAFNPAGLLEPRRSPSDPQDRLRLLEGLDMAQLDYFVGDHVFSAVFSSDLLTNEDEAKRRYDLALRANVLVPSWNLDLAVVAMVSNIKNTGSLTFNYVLGDALELHGEVTGTLGTVAQYPRSILPDKQEGLFGRTYLDQLKVDEPRLFLRYVVGLNYTLPWGTNLIGEFYHTDQGLSVLEWDRYMAQTDYSRRAYLSGDYLPVFDGRSLPEVNLLQSLSWFAGQDLRKNYLFLRASQSWMAERLNAQVLTLVSLDDLSAAYVGEVSYLLRRGTTIYARGSMFSGGRTSQYGNVGQRGSLITGALFSF
jgi:hypothetical protein